MRNTLTRGSAFTLIAMIAGLLAIAPTAIAQKLEGLGDQIASEETHPMPPNDEEVFPALPQDQKDEGHPPAIAGGPTTCSGTALGLFYPFDRNNTTGWTSAMARTDDGSSALINLGFTFQFYGTNYSSCYINNNGNITFGAAYSPYVPTGFPSASVPPMIAPFWADVDTRNTATGRVWYKIIDSNSGGLPDTLIVTWDNVSYYNSHSDLQNTFQLVISNFTNPQMQPGSNVCFDYDNMCWTTGDINGTDGFTDPPSATTGNASVGINKGDGVGYFQVGRFGVSGTAYDGPFGLADGISYLDNKRFCFNTQTGNVPPVASGLPTNNTFSIPAGQVLNRQIQFLSPEIGQSTTITYIDQDSAVPAGLVLGVTNGNVARLDLDWTTGCSDVGSYTLLVTARDNFSPQGVTTVTLTINVTEVNTVPTVAITDPTTLECVCDNFTIRGTATGTNFNSYALEYSATPAGPYTLISSSTTPVVNGILGTWDTAPVAAQGYYYLRLRATNDCGPSAIAFVLVFVDKMFDAVELRSPTAGQVLGGVICFDGTVQDGNSSACFNNYTISYAPPPFVAYSPVNPATPTYTMPVTNDPLGSWNTRTGPAAVADGTYRVRVLGTDDCGFTRSATRDIVVDNTIPIAFINSPLSCAAVGGVVPVTGVVSDANLSGWTLQYIGGNAHNWVTIASGNSAVNGLLANWNTAGLPSCAYALRLVASDRAGVDCSSNTHQVEYMVTVGVGFGLRGDMDCDGTVNNFDVDGFLMCLSQGICGCP